MNLQLYGRSSGELSALDKMSNALIMGRRMHGAVGIASLHSEPIIQHAAATTARVASAARAGAGRGAGNLSLFGVVFTDEMLFWAVFFNILFVILLMFMLTLHMLGKMPKFMRCGKRGVRYESIEAADAGIGSDGKDGAGNYTIVGVGVDGGEGGADTAEDQEKEKLIPTKPDDAA